MSVGRLPPWAPAQRAALVVDAWGSEYILAVRDLGAADAQDGAADGDILVRNIARQPNSWEVVGLGQRWQSHALIAAGDADADDVDDLLVGAGAAGDGAVLFSSAALAALRPTRPSGRIELYRWSDWAAPTMRFTGSARRDWLGSGVSFAGDIDGDGAADTAIGARGDDAGGADAGAVYVVLAQEVATLDRLDGTADRMAALANLAGDTDGDGIHNPTDEDDDNDGFPDVDDAFQLDATEWADTDNDGYGDNGDAFPGDRREWRDTDFDGIGDNADTDDDGDGIADADERGMEWDTDNDGLDNDVDADDDNDGVADADDAFPVDAAEQTDTDGDGIGNNADDDDDNDGVADADDAFPLDSAETQDSDGDGYGDNGDAFPNDPAEWVDTDNDGIGNGADTDDDGDGVADADDDLPLDATGSVDTDGDGVADPNDAFPNDAGEWADHDSDGIGDNADADDDNDGVADADDLFPKNVARWDLASFKFSATAPGDRLGTAVAAVGDVNDDGHADILLAAATAHGQGAFYLVSSADLVEADAADGTSDGQIASSRIARQPRSALLVVPDAYRSAGTMGSIGDVGGDGRTEVGLAAEEAVGAVYVVSASDLADGDSADGNGDHQIRLDNVPRQHGSWKLRGHWGAPLATSPEPIGDTDGDGVAEVFVGEPGAGSGDQPGTAYVLSGSALATVDALDRNADGVVHLRHAKEVQENWRFVGQNGLDSAATALASADFDGDGASDFVIGAPPARRGGTRHGCRLPRGQSRLGLGRRGRRRRRR